MRHGYNCYPFRRPQIGRSQIAIRGVRHETEEVQRQPRPAHWGLTARIAFRFCFVYFGLYCLATQIVTTLFSPNQGDDIPDPATLWPLRKLILWTAVHILHVRTTVAYDSNSGSGDGIFGWVLAFCLLVIAILATGFWSVLDRKRENYVKLSKWFRLFIRFSLAGQMLNYGMSKVIPVQMPYPSLTRLLEPFGNFSPMGVLWSSIGASRTYEIFAGCAEVLAGLLLIVPRTAMFGALICLADMIQVFMLNMTYDVPVKLFSFHLILLALLLLAPDLPRLVNVFFRNRTVAPSAHAQTFITRRANRAALTAQILFGLWLVGMNVYGSWTAWHLYGGGRSNSALYGIWNVDQLTIDGQIRPPLLTDNERWRRVIFDFPTRMAFQRMDDSIARYGTSINVNGKILALTNDDNKNWKASFAFQRPAQDQLVLDGDMDSHKVHMQLKLLDRNKFLLVSRGFHWIQETPINR
jgi:hypothetical protein